MSVSHLPVRRERRTQKRQPDQRLSVRWTVIIGLSTACGVLVGSAEGPAAGIVAALTAAGLLDQIVRHR